MIRIGLLGGPGCGKSTQAAHLFATLRAEGKIIEQVQELAREAINRNLLPHDGGWPQLFLHDEQRKREDSLPPEVQVLVTDSPLLLGYVYALQYAKLPQDRLLLQVMYERFLEALERYSFLFLLEREKPYMLDSTRRQDERSARAIDLLIQRLLAIHNCPYTVLVGSIEERTKTIRERIGL